MYCRLKQIYVIYFQILKYNCGRFPKVMYFIKTKITLEVSVRNLCVLVQNKNILPEYFLLPRPLRSILQAHFIWTNVKYK